MERAADKSISIREFIYGKEGTESEGGLKKWAEEHKASSSTTGDEAERLGRACDVIERLRVLDGTDKDNVVESLAKSVGGERLIVLANDSALRAISYNTRHMKTQVDLFMIGYEHFTKEGWLQAWARVDRGTSRFARRIVVLERPALRNNLELALESNTQFMHDAKRGIFERGSSGEVLLRKYEQSKNDGEKLTLREELQLSAEFLSIENRGKSALFFINEQTSMQLLKQPLQEMVTAERLAGNKKGADYLDKAYRGVLDHSDRTALDQGVNLQDYQSIAANAFNSSAKNAAEVWSRVAREGRKAGVSADLVQKARLRALDIANAMTKVGKGFEDFVSAKSRGEVEREEDRPTFLKVPGSINGSSPAEAVLKVVVRLGEDYILPSTALGKKIEPLSVVQTPGAFSRQAESRDGPAGKPATRDINSVANVLASDTQYSQPSSVPTLSVRAASARVLTPAGQKLAAAALALLDLDDDERESVLSNVGYAGASTLLAQSEFLAKFKNAGQALAMGHALSEMGVSFDAATSQTILSSADPRTELVRRLRAIGGQDRYIGAEGTFYGVLLNDIETDQNTGSNQYRDLTLGKDGLRLTWRASLAQTWRHYTGGSTEVSNLMKSRLSEFFRSGAIGAKKAAAFAFLMDPTLTYGQTTRLERRLTHAVEMGLSDVGRARFNDLVQLARNDNQDGVSTAQFVDQTLSGTPVSDQKWFKPVLYTGAAMVAGGVGIVTGVGILATVGAMISAPMTLAKAMKSESTTKKALAIAGVIAAPALMMNFAAYYGWAQSGYSLVSNIARFAPTALWTGIAIGSGVLGALGIKTVAQVVITPGAARTPEEKVLRTNVRRAMAVLGVNKYEAQVKKQAANLVKNGMSPEQAQNLAERTVPKPKLTRASAEAVAGSIAQAQDRKDLVTSPTFHKIAAAILAALTPAFMGASGPASAGAGVSSLALTTTFSAGVGLTVVLSLWSYLAWKNKSLRPVPVQTESPNLGGARDWVYGFFVPGQKPADSRAAFLNAREQFKTSAAMPSTIPFKDVDAWFDTIDLETASDPDKMADLVKNLSGTFGHKETSSLREQMQALPRKQKKEMQKQMPALEAAQAKDEARREAGNTAEFAEAVFALNPAEFSSRDFNPAHPCRPQPSRGHEPQSSDFCGDMSGF